MRAVWFAVLTFGCVEGGKVGVEDTDAADTVPTDDTLYLAMSVHLEGWDVSQDEIFERAIDAIDDARAVYDQYGAKVTWEAQDLLRESIDRGDTSLADLHASAHEVAVHADAGYSMDPAYDQAEFLATLQTFYADYETLVRAPPTAVSGICSELDWVQTVVDAGFSGTSGVVEYCLKSLDEVPAEAADCEAPNTCHAAYPSEMPAQLHPWRTSSGATWTTADPTGALVVVPEATNMLCGAESLVEESPTHCDFGEDDVDVYFDRLDEALTMLDPDEVNVFKGTYSQGRGLDLDLQEAWLERLQPYVDAGQVQWATMTEVISMVE